MAYRVIHIPFPKENKRKPVDSPQIEQFKVFRGIPCPSTRRMTARHPQLFTSEDTPYKLRQRAGVVGGCSGASKASGSWQLLSSPQVPQTAHSRAPSRGGQRAPQGRPRAVARRRRPAPAGRGPRTTDRGCAADVQHLPAPLPLASDDSGPTASAVGVAGGPPMRRPVVGPAPDPGGG